MFPTSVMQKNEEDLLNKVDEYCNEYFLKRLREPNHVIGHACCNERSWRYHWED